MKQNRSKKLPNVSSELLENSRDLRLLCLLLSQTSFSQLTRNSKTPPNFKTLLLLLLPNYID